MTQAQLRKLATYIQWRLDKCDSPSLEIKREYVEEFLAVIELAFGELANERRAKIERDKARGPSKVHEVSAKQSGTRAGAGG